MTKKTILCIDDMRTNLLTMESVIDELAKGTYDIVTAMSANKGMEILLNQNVDIILLDVIMPDIDGFECAKMIRADEATKNIPIIFVTASQNDATIEKCYQVGGDDYINKPFNHTELLSRISFHLKSREQERLLNQEKEYTQSILDLQENLILVTDGANILNVNNAFLEFFGVESIEEFRAKDITLGRSFVNEDEYFHLELLEDGIIWVDEVIKRSKKEDVLVKIVLNNKEYIFNLKATHFLDQYIVTLTDITQISQISLEYKHEASYDALTQIYNRNMFNRLIKLKIAKARETDSKLVFIILDIDFFKNVNDTYGHLVGDNVLKHLTKLIQSQTRENDLFARWGGEEFVLAFDVAIDRGFSIADNLRKHIEQEVFEDVEHVTCSFGITEFRIGDTLDSLILRADKALYEAKGRGRNRVCKV